VIKDKAKQTERLVPLTVEEWDTTVYVKLFNLLERVTFLDNYPEHDIQLYTVINGICEQDGTPAFTDSDRDWLVNSNGAALEYLAWQVLVQNKLLASDIEAMKKKL
jgi:hypothetical protein